MLIYLWYIAKIAQSKRGVKIKNVTTGTRQNQRDLESEFSRIRIDQGTRPAAAAGARYAVLYGWL